MTEHSAWKDQGRRNVDITSQDSIKYLEIHFDADMMINTDIRKAAEKATESYNESRLYALEKKHTDELCSRCNEEQQSRLQGLSGLPRQMPY